MKDVNNDLKTSFAHQKPLYRSLLARNVFKKYTSVYYNTDEKSFFFASFTALRTLPHAQSCLCLYFSPPSLPLDLFTGCSFHCLLFMENIITPSFHYGIV